MSGVEPTRRGTQKILEGVGAAMRRARLAVTAPSRDHLQDRSGKEGSNERKRERFGTYN